MMSILSKFLPQKREVEVEFVLPSLVDGSDIFNSVQASRNDPAKVKSAFDGFKSATEQRRFLRYFSDSEIISAGIAKDVPEIAQRWPNLRN